VSPFQGRADFGAQPRASRIHLPHRPDLHVAIWMGGTDSLLGDPIPCAELGRALVVDCAGDLASAYRRAAAAYIPRVFMDAELVPYSYPRLALLVHELAAAATGPDQIERIYILCQYGMNRSGLLTGLLLRALGEAAGVAIDLVRAARPGALSNQTFTRLIADWACPQL
jgi:hypothetical protein